MLRLQLPANQNFRYRAGQYVEVLLRDGARRSYSMANAMHTIGSPPAIELHLRHMPGGKFTDHVFGAMKEKEILRVEGPFGSFFLREDSKKPMILLASGTGLAPIKALIERMQHQKIRRPAALYWGGRRPRDLYMDGEGRRSARGALFRTTVRILRQRPVRAQPTFAPGRNWTPATTDGDKHVERR